MLYYVHSMSFSLSYTPGLKHLSREPCMFGSGGQTDCKMGRDTVLVGKPFDLDSHSSNA